MATVRIRVVASADSSLSNVFVPLSKAAENARKKVGEEMAAGAKAAAHPYATKLPAASKAAFEALTADMKKAAKGFEPIKSEAKQTAAALGHLADGSREKFAQLAAGLRALPADLKVVSREAQRELDKIQRHQARAALGLSSGRSGGGGALGDIALGAAGRVASGALSFGAQVGGDLIRGVGVNTDLSSMFAQHVGLESLATQVSNSGYMKNDARNGFRVDTRDLMKQATAVGTETAFDPTQVLEGLSKFTGKTGDLATGREALKDLARLSKATGTNLEDMVSAAGDVSNVLGDVPNKGKAIYDVMKSVAGQGKLGAVEVKDLATQMAKLSSSAQMFSGDRATNISLLGAIVQEAKQFGGASSASQAANAGSRFTAMFSKKARLDAFRAFDVNVQDAHGFTRGPEDLILDSLRAAMSHGGEKKFGENVGKMYSESNARIAVRGFETKFHEAYSAAGGTEQEKLAAGAAAVRAEFDRLTQSAMSEKEVQDSFARAMGTAEAKAQVFNNKLADVAGQVEDNLLPALVDLAPAAIAVAKAMAGAVEWWTGHQDKSKIENEIAGGNVLNAGAEAVRSARGRGVPLLDVAPADLPEKVFAEQKARDELLARAKTRLEGFTGALHPERYSEDQIHKLAQSPISAFGPGSDEGNALGYLEARKGLADAQANADFARGIADAVRQALTDKTLTVHVASLPPPREKHSRLDSDSE